MNCKLLTLIVLLFATYNTVAADERNPAPYSSFEQVEAEAFVADDSEALFGNELKHTVECRGGSLSGLGEEPIRLHIRMENADLYSLRFVK